MERKGIISAGNWLVDNIKIIERYPTRGNRTTISRIEKHFICLCFIIDIAFADAVADNHQLTNFTRFYRVILLIDNAILSII